MITEEIPKDLINTRYFEDEFNMLLEEVHFKTSTNTISLSWEDKAHLEKRRETIEQNKIQIIKDLNRTFVNSAIFGKDSEGRKHLMNVLEVVALKYTGIGYVQGMNFVVAAFLYHWSPAVTLGLMSYLLENLQLWDVYAENLVGVHYHNQRLTKLLEKHLPNLDKHLKEYDVNLEIFSTQWIIDLFSHIIPLKDYWLFLDSFLKQKWDFFYRLVLTVLELMSPEILSLWDWSEILEGIKEGITKTNWKKAISLANYKFLKL